MPKDKKVEQKPKERKQPSAAKIRRWSKGSVPLREWEEYSRYSMELIRKSERITGEDLAIRINAKG